MRIPIWKLHVIDLIEQVLKSLFNVLTSLCTRLKVGHIVLLCDTLCFFCRDLSLGHQVCLAAEDHCDHAGNAMVRNRLDPVRYDCLVRLSVRQVKADHDALGLLIKRRGEWAVSLLAGCVPNYDFAVLYAPYLLQTCWLLVNLHEINTHGLHTPIVKFSAGVYFRNASLPNCCIAN